MSTGAKNWSICDGCGHVTRTGREVQGETLCRACRSPVLRWLHSRRWYWRLTAPLRDALSWARQIVRGNGAA